MHFAPGDYDAGVGGLKVCVLPSEGRPRRYIITGFYDRGRAGDKLAADVRKFYQHAADGLRGGYPDVQSGTMASLKEAGRCTFCARIPPSWSVRYAIDNRG